MKQVDVPCQAKWCATTANTAAAKPFWEKCAAAAEAMREQADAAVTQQAVEVKQICDAPCPTFDSIPHPGFLHKQGFVTKSKFFRFGYVWGIASSR